MMKDELYQFTRDTAFGKEFGNIAQGDGLTGKKGTNCAFVMMQEKIARIPKPKDRALTHSHIVIDYRPQKDDPNWVRITAGKNLIEYPFKLTVHTGDLTTAKTLWNSILSTRGTEAMCIDVKCFYRCTPVDKYEYTKMQSSIFLTHARKQYDLWTTKQMMASSTWKSEMQYTGFPKEGSWSTSSCASASSSSHFGALRSPPPRQVYSAARHIPSSFSS